ncbi:PREDICTED: intercellular adhesion molecule 3 [Galeopterus variegatus]|uniref:Intercellular adhesion molecule 3 n=1 Tax=Galeopterus variegatus TaxID=482537 RepID=A0ABM0R6K6_GALVR|nr:PREDICTED: intercellular adhesion molecule 3 [Galeopterus variegatus]
MLPVFAFRGRLVKSPSSLRLATMVPSWPLPGACWALLTFCCVLPSGTQGQEFLLRVEPQDLVIPAGGSLLVNCSTRCPHAELINLETSLSKERAGNGLGWAAFWLSNVTDDSHVLCSSFCNGSQMISSSVITVYRFPESVELAPLPPWQPVGENFTLHCQVVGGEPRAHLTAVLLRGEEALSRQLVVGNPANVTATVLASRGDHRANFSCRTELDLRPLGLVLFQNTSAPRRLRTFVLPATAPRLEVPQFLEVGTSWRVDCTLEGLFPASEAYVHLALGNQMLKPVVTSHGDTLTATATARADQEGTWKIVCNMTLGGESREAHSLTVFDRNSRSVNFAMGVLVILGVVVVTGALTYVFWTKRSGIYHVKQESTSLPLTSVQSEGVVGEEPSSAARSLGS